MLVRPLLALALTVPAAAPLAAPTARPPARVRYQPPVDAAIVDRFRPPACRWCPGNRGIDYGTGPGTPVHASADGIVTFAGAVGRLRHVVVGHADGLRTTYADLATIVVTGDQRVRAGQLLGTTRGQLHFGVRRGDVYLDPELVLAGARPRARLVPLHGRPRAPGRSPARPLGVRRHPSRPLASTTGLHPRRPITHAPSPPAVASGRGSGCPQPQGRSV